MLIEGKVHKIMIMKETVNTKDLKNCSTPEELYRVIEKYLNQVNDSTLGSQDLEVPYQEARNAVIRFRKLYKGLPTLPDYNNNITAGLQEIMEWCIAAIDIVHNMVRKLDSSIIEETIDLLKKLRELPASSFPTIDEHLWNKAKQRAQRIVDKYHASTSKRKASMGLLSSRHYMRTRFLYAAEIISSLTEVARRKTRDSTLCSYLLDGKSITSSPLSKRTEEALIEINFCKAIEKIYRLMDKTYADALAKLEENILQIINRINQLDSTPTGDLLDKYDKLSGIHLQHRFNKIGRAYSIDSIVESALFGTPVDSFFGRESRESLIDSVIGTLKEISQASRSETKRDTIRAKLWKRAIWLKNHPHSYGLTGGVILLILFFVLGLAKAQWRNLCWGTAGVALLVLILSLLGGRSSKGNAS